MSHNELPLPLILTPDGPVPIYLQIKSQISYLITSGQLTTGARLPPVRTVATALRINPGTVAQAYRELQHEGLIDAAVGRGTFVAPTLPVPADLGVRQREATAALEHALTRLRSLGLPDAEARLRFEATLASRAARCHVLLVAPTAAIAKKYAGSLLQHLGPELAVHPIDVATAEQRSAKAKKLLELCYYVVTFASMVRRVQTALEPYDRPFQVLGMTTELQASSIAELGRLPVGTRALVLSEERYAHQSLAIMVKHSSLHASDVDLVTLESLAGADPVAALRRGSYGRLLDDANGVLIHTFGATPIAERLVPPPRGRMELRFDVTLDSLQRLRSILLPG